MTLAAPLVDPHGRVVRDLRISVTDRCNFRCTYCMPAEGMKWLDRAALLTFEEIERVARVCVERFGFGSVRLTGGEPTVRARLPILVERLARLGVDVALTTNGATLALLADDLKRAGLARINISLDSLRPDRFLAITRRPALEHVLEGIDAARAAGLDPVKVNVVMVRGVNDDEAVDFATFGRDRNVQVRFIEFMPLDADHEWTRDQVVPAAEIVAAIDAVYPLEPVAPVFSAEAGGTSRASDDAAPGRTLTGGTSRLSGGAAPTAASTSAPAARWRYRDGGGEIGVIASVTAPFCGSCDRIRLTSEGQLRSCLFATRESDLRPILRSGGSDDALAAAIAAEVGTKWAGHSIGTPVFVRPSRSMSQIGG